MSTLQEKVNLAFHKAHLKERPNQHNDEINTKAKKAWLKQAWPELEKPPIQNLAEKKYKELTAKEVKTLSIY